MKRLLSLLLAALCAASLISCNGRETTPPDAQTNAVLDFRLGEGAMEEAAGEVTFPLDGLLGVPEADNCPVVFILHGAHGVEDVTEMRHYQGFSYLVESLAKQGYLAVAININRALSFEPFEGNELVRIRAMFAQYYDLITRANGGEAIFTQDLTGKADLTKLNFIGHSRGGDMALSLAKALEGEGDESVRSVLSVCAAITSPVEALYSDVPTGIILSQYDGDIVSQDSMRLFHQAWFADEARQTPVTLAYLYGGNHNRFNSAIAHEDGLAAPEGVTLLDGGIQRAFLSLYAADFLNVFNRDGDLSGLLGEGASERYGIDFMPSILLPGGVRYLPDEAVLPLAEVDGMDFSAGIFSAVPQRNTIAPFNPPGTLAEDITLYRLRWSAMGQCVTAQLGESDWSQWQSLSLLIANDSTAPGNDGSTPLALDVILTDASGAAATVTLDAQQHAALRYIPAKVENVFAGMDNMPEYLLATRPTPLGTLHLPLEQFQSVDLSRITAVTIRSESSTGACILGGLRVN